MKGLFVSVYLDEDVSALIGDLLRARGFSALTTRDAGNLSNTDSSQLEYAVRNSLTLITHNRDDFAQLAQKYFAEGRTHFGIVLLVRRSPQETARRLIAVFNQLTVDEIKNQVIYL